MPVFWLGLMLVLFFAVELQVLPAMGMSSVDGPREGVGRMLDVAGTWCCRCWRSRPSRSGQYVRLARSAVAEVMGESYITTVRAIGFPERTILMHYALRNALLPVVTVLGLQLGLVLTGAVLTETVFSWPGLGRLIYDAILARDTPVIMGAFIVMSVTVALASLATDLVYAALDPRVKLYVIAAALVIASRSRVALAASVAHHPGRRRLAVAAPFLPLPGPQRDGRGPIHAAGRGALARHGQFRARRLLAARLGNAARADGRHRLVGDREPPRHRARLVAGYFGGSVDAVLSRSFDVFLLIPSFFLVLLIVALFGSSIAFTMVAIALTTWPRSARIMRAQVLSLKSRVYVQAARSAGASHLRTLLRHVVPNGLAPIVTDATILMGLAILTEAGLSFLGLGDQNAVSWGRMIFEGQRQLRLAPWMSFFPGSGVADACGVVQPARRRAQPGPQPPAAPPCGPGAAPAAAGHDGRGGGTVAGRADARGARAAPWPTPSDGREPPRRRRRVLRSAAGRQPRHRRRERLRQVEPRCRAAAGDGAQRDHRRRRRRR